MVSDFYDKVVVWIKYRGGSGSGVLISSMEKNNSYLISAWHCFGKQSNINYGEIEVFRQEENELKQIFLNFKDSVIIEQNDYRYLRDRLYRRHTTVSNSLSRK